LEKVTAQDSVTAAWQALAGGQLDKAESLYRRALQAQPRNQEGTLGLASVLHRKGNREGAWKAYREVLAQSPDNAIAVTGMMILLSESDPASAESRIKQFIDARPGEEGPQLALGHLMARQKRWSEAQAAFFAAYTLQPSSASNNYNLAVALDQLHQHGQALKFYRAALEGTGVQNIPADSARQRIKTLSAQGVDKP
jgi:tetratricopeptide (TPR) repeat protein